MARRAKSQPRIAQASWEVVEQKLRLEWSPEQITGWLKAKQSESINHEWIYQYILQDKQQRGDLYKFLRCQKKRRKRYGSYDRRGQLTGRTSIDGRLQIVDKRIRIGDLRSM